MNFDPIRQTVLCIILYYFLGVGSPGTAGIDLTLKDAKGFQVITDLNEAGMEILQLSHGEALFAFIRNVGTHSCQQTASVLPLLI